MPGGEILKKIIESRMATLLVGIMLAVAPAGCRVFGVKIGADFTVSMVLLAGCCLILSATGFISERRIERIRTTEMRDALSSLSFKQQCMLGYCIREGTQTVPLRNAFHEDAAGLVVLGLLQKPMEGSAAFTVPKDVWKLIKDNTDYSLILRGGDYSSELDYWIDQFQAGDMFH